MELFLIMEDTEEAGEARRPFLLCSLLQEGKRLTVRAVQMEETAGGGSCGERYPVFMPLAGDGDMHSGSGPGRGTSF